MEGANDLKAGAAHRHAVALDDGRSLIAIGMTATRRANEWPLARTSCWPRRRSGHRGDHRDIRAGGEKQLGGNRGGCQFANARVSRHDRNHPGATLTRSCLACPMRFAPAARGGGAPRTSRNAPPHGARPPIAISGIHPAAPISTIDGHGHGAVAKVTGPQPSIRCLPGSRERRGAGAVGRESRRGGALEAGREKSRGARNRAAMGRAEQVPRHCSGSRSKG